MHHFFEAITNTKGDSLVAYLLSLKRGDRGCYGNFWIALAGDDDLHRFGNADRALTGIYRQLGVERQRRPHGTSGTRRRRVKSASNRLPIKLAATPDSGRHFGKLARISTGLPPQPAPEMRRIALH